MNKQDKYIEDSVNSHARLLMAVGDRVGNERYNYEY